MTNHKMLEAVVEGVMPALKEYIDGCLAGLKPERGERGDKGDPGEAGSPGRDGVDGKDGRDGDAGPMGAKGADGLNGKDGRDGIDGRNGATGKDGAPGLNGKDGAPGRDGLPGVPGRDGTNGKDGADGFGLEDLDAKLAEDGRTVLFQFNNGKMFKEIPLKFPVVIYRGVWDHARSYDQGDSVTWGGGWTVCMAPTTAKPGESNDWALAVRRGRDGKDGKDAIAPAPPIKLK